MKIAFCFLFALLMAPKLTYAFDPFASLEETILSAAQNISVSIHEATTMVTIDLRDLVEIFKNYSPDINTSLAEIARSGTAALPHLEQVGNLAEALQNTIA